MQQIMTTSQTSTSDRGAYAAPDTAKRVTDVALIVLTAPIVLPLFLVITAVLLLQGSSVFYSQERAGRDGRTFKLWKFRSMVPDADEILAQHLAYNADARAEWRSLRKLRDDPRVTAFGRFLRASSMDELPQLWNILRGEMSLVGPRPVPRAELFENYGRAAQAYLSCRPGLTGLWQVSGRNRVTYSRRVQLDTYYAQHHNALMDLTILIMTVAVVLRGDGM